MPVLDPGPSRSKQKSIRTVIEEKRNVDLDEVRTKANRVKGGIEAKISKMDEQVIGLRQKIHDTYAGDFIEAAQAGQPGGPSILNQLTPEEKAVMEQRLQ